MKKTITMPQVDATFALLCYNQERYILDSISSALSQEHCYLEILISDDASTDATFNMAQHFLKGYCGPHQVKLRRNSSNVGLTEHINIIQKLASSRIIIGAAGDDISRPERAAKIITALSSVTEKIVYIHSDCSSFSDTNGAVDLRQRFAPLLKKSIVENIRLNFPGVHGATGAFTSDSYDFFGPLINGCVVEDHALAFRAALVGKIIYIPEDLVRYRIHSSNLSTTSEAVVLRWNRFECIRRVRLWKAAMGFLYKQYELDLNIAIAVGRFDEGSGHTLRQEIARARIRHALMSDIELWVWSEAKIDWVKVIKAILVRNYTLRELVIRITKKTLILFRSVSTG